MVKKITITTTYASNPNNIRPHAYWKDEIGNTHHTNDYRGLVGLFEEIFLIGRFDPKDKFEISFENNPNSIYNFDFIEYLSANLPKNNQ